MKSNPTNLAKICKMKHLLQRELSERANISKKTVEGLCSGARDINKANVSTVFALASALECDITDILETQIDEFGNKVIVDGENKVIVKKNPMVNRMMAYVNKL